MKELVSLAWTQEDVSGPIWNLQWRIQRHSDADIPVWVSKLCAQIKGELMQNNFGYLICSTQMRLQVVRYLI